MQNMTDGTKDGLALVYVKDGIVYPIAIGKEELQVLDALLGATLEEIKLVNKPMGLVRILGEE